MRNFTVIIRPLIICILCICGYAESISATQVVYQIDLKKEVGSNTWIYVKKGLDEAKKEHADVIILNMNTYGGLVVYADSIRTAIINSKIPFYAFIDNNAASAGALIAIACDSIYMNKGANIGAASVVNQSGEKMPDKYQSYMRSTIRSTAESHGKVTVRENGRDTLIWHRDPLIAEAMVDDRVVVPGIVNDEQILTFTTEEAIRNHYCEGEASSVKDIIENRLNIKDYVLKKYEPSMMDETMGWLTSPVLQSILIMIIILGIYYELQTPGMGFPSVAALVAAALYFAPLYVEGLAANWEIILFFIGLVLISLEIFVIPGFGIAGIAGGILVAGTLILALVDNDFFNFERIDTGDFSRAILTVVAGICLGFAGMLMMLHYIGTKGFFRCVSLEADQKVEDGFIAVPVYNNLVGEQGVSATYMRPCGKIIIDATYYDAVAMYGVIEKNHKVKVVKYENAQLYVIKDESR